MTLPGRQLVPLLGGLVIAACGSGGGSSDAGANDAGINDAGVACSVNNPEPDVCGWGYVCFDNATCDVAYDDRCTNVTQAISKGNYTSWSSGSPVIWNVVDEPTDVQADCANATDVPFTVTIYAYAGSTTFPSTSSGLSGFWYFTTTGGKVDIAASLLRPSNYLVSNQGNNMEAKFTLCGSPGATQIQAAFAFTNGNAFCKTLTH